MASKDRIKLFFGAGLALAVGVVFADTTPVVSTTPVVRQTFEDGASEDDVVGTWSGDGTVKEESIASIGNSVVSPISSESASAKVLAIAGTVTCNKSESPTASGNYVVSDFLVNITEGSDEDFTATTPNGMADVQIAVAAGKATTGDNPTIPLCVYCIPKSAATATWFDTGIAIDKTTWHRLTLVFDYGNKTCQVNWDGVPVMTDEGYLKADKTGTVDKTGTEKGSWYNLATSDKTSIASLRFVGAASIDDVLVTQGADKTDPSYGASAVAAVALLDDANKKVSIPLNDLSKWGVDSTTITTAKIDNSGMTVAQKLVAGLEPGDNTKFEFTNMALGSGNAANTATIRFRGSTEAKHGVLPSYTVKVNGTAVAMTGDPTGENGIVTASIPLDDKVPVNKITIEATAKVN